MRTILATLHSKFIHNSLALPCLASYCGTECGAIQILEFTVHEPRESILFRLIAESPDVVAFSVYLWNRRETLDLVDALAVARPGTRIILGGPEVSFDDHDLFDRHPGLTALVRGEGEIPLKGLLEAWAAERDPGVIPRLARRTQTGILEGPNGPPLPDLDRIPSPFQAGLVDLDRGFVYYETGRGCPFHCSFCLSARDDRVRSFSMARICADLALLQQHEVPKVKLVDRTFNYDPQRTREIFAYILANNRSTHFHFEIAAHLLDEATLTLLDDVPHGMFQFEIGIQSTLENTLSAIDRKVDLDRLETNVRRLSARGRIHLHLDLVAGLPGEDMASFMASINRVAALRPHHLQIEPVKLLPGSPLREDAMAYGLRFDPNPPYTILATPTLEVTQLQHIVEISRLLDLTFNAGCMPIFLKTLAGLAGSFAKGLEHLAGYWRDRDLFRYPCSRQKLFDYCWQFICNASNDEWRIRLKNALAYDHARSERVILNRIPDYFDTQLTTTENTWVQTGVRNKTDHLKRQAVKLQYFAAAFHHLEDSEERSVRLFFYLTRTGVGMSVEELRYPEEHVRQDSSPPQLSRQGPSEDRS